MALVRGIAFVLFCAALFAAGGGLLAAALNGIAPGYYPAVFPSANRHSFAASAGIGTGIAQGLLLGLLIGSISAVTLGACGQLEWKSCARSIAILASLIPASSLLGGLIGLALGTSMPDYYRRVLPTAARSPDFSATDAAIGLGASEGAIVGAVLGGLAILVLAVATWKHRTSLKANA